MKELFILFIAIIICNFAEAYEYPYETPDNSYRDSGTPTEIYTSTPIKTQDGVGLCYGFSATSLLENYRCKELNLDCSDSNDFLSSLDVTSYYQHQSLTEGGNTYKLLSNIERSKRKLAKENCVKFSVLVHQMVDPKNNIIKDEKRGWIFLVKKWNEYKGIGEKVKRNDCVTCLSDSIKETLVNIETPRDQIKDAFLSARTLEEFIYKSLLPAQCLEDNKMISIPTFKTKTFSSKGANSDLESLTNKIESVIEAGIPLELGVCGQKDYYGACVKDKGHSIALFGIKEVCSSKNKDCKTLVKVKNSYGNTWQQRNNDGWVSLRSLAESSLLFTDENNITWLEKPGFILPEKIKKPLPVFTLPANNEGSRVIPSQYKSYNGIWKCPGSKFSDRYEPGCSPLK